MLAPSELEFKAELALLVARAQRARGLSVMEIARRCKKQLKWPNSAKRSLLKSLRAEPLICLQDDHFFSSSASSSLDSASAVVASQPRAKGKRQDRGDSGVPLKKGDDDAQKAQKVDSEICQFFFSDLFSIQLQHNNTFEQMVNLPSDASDSDLMQKQSEESLLHEIFFNQSLLKSPGQDVSVSLVGRSLCKKFASVALLGMRSVDATGETAGEESDEDSIHAPDSDVYLNTSEPFCVCCVGVQGGGKSHTLSVLLENCLLPLPGPSADRPVVRLQQPMTAMVLHYDVSTTSVCEATGLTDIRPALFQSKQAHALPKEKMTILVSPSYFLARRVFSSIFVFLLLVNHTDSRSINYSVLKKNKLHKFEMTNYYYLKMKNIFCII